MIVKIDAAVRDIIRSELGYTVDPSVMSFANLTDAEYPVCLIDYGDEVASEDQTLRNFTNNLPMEFEIAVLSDEENYRIKAFEQLSVFKKLINDMRELIEVRYPEACIIDMDYDGSSLLGFDSNRVAGAILVKTTIKYQQCRANPQFKSCGGNC